MKLSKNVVWGVLINFTGKAYEMHMLLKHFHTKIVFNSLKKKKKTFETFGSSCKSEQQHECQSPSHVTVAGGSRASPGLLLLLLASHPPLLGRGMLRELSKPKVWEFPPSTVNMLGTDLRQLGHAQDHGSTCHCYASEWSPDNSEQWHRCLDILATCGWGVPVPTQAYCWES